jgi:two-component system, OmpR family, sensor histidine kinase KdpD
MTAQDSTPRRPDPDALLALSQREVSGRLKIFLGAAPGVGKTYAMLAAAQRLKAEGRDLLLGLIETHGRQETEALMRGLEVLPRRRFDYRGQQLEEFDLDAALARHPDLLVVDELAHTNAPDSRHPKRWQDVKELLDAGIDVWTALNIQHLESLADVVAQITGVTVRETVPDSILQTAQDVVLVDITPDELITRLKAGKIYLPQTAQRATENFFTPGNLTALRELALRRTADRVEDQMTQILRQKAIEGPWGTAERLLVCVGPDEDSEKLVRQAARLATSLNAGWIAVSLTKPGLPAELSRDHRISANLDLATSLGAEVQRLTSDDFAQDILRIARRENVTQIVVGRRERAPLLRRFAASLPTALLRGAGDISVLVIPLNDGTEAGESVLAAAKAWVTRPGLIADLGHAALFTGLGIAIGHGLRAVMELPNLSMIFLVGVLACSSWRGTRSAVLAAVLSFLAYNFFFIDPVQTMTIARPHELFALLIFLVVATLTGSLTGRIRAQARAALAQTRVIEAQASFSRKLAAASTEDDVLWATVTQVHAMLGGKAMLLVVEGTELVARAAWPPDELADPAELTAARWALDKAEAAGWRTGTLPNIRFRFQPLTTSRRVVAVLGFEPPQRDAPLAAEEETKLDALVEQAAIALDRALLVREAVKAAALQENENIRDALLASLSHDLRTPLAAITGSVSTLQQRGQALPEAQQQDLLQTIGQEAGRLNRFVTNLLEMSRIESGAIKVKRDWVDVGDAIRTAAERCAKAHAGRSPRISLAPDLKFIRGDQDLLGQVVFNLLDNAQKYAEAGEVTVHARNEADQVLISVTDEGPGIKAADLDRIFEKFYRGGGTDRRKPGTGLGLSICRGLIQAMGGSIIAESPAARRRGTRMVVRLPAAELPTSERES